MVDTFELNAGISIKSFTILKTVLNAALKANGKKSTTVTSDDKFISGKTFFEEYAGEVHVGKAVCYSDDLKIVPGIRPKFTVQFIEGRIIS